MGYILCALKGKVFRDLVFPFGVISRFRNGFGFRPLNDFREHCPGSDDHHHGVQKQTGSRLPLVFTFLCAALLLSGCAMSPETVHTTSEPVLPGVIVMLPFKNMAEIYGQGQSFRCPLSDRFHTTGEIEADAERIMTEILIGKLIREQELKLIPPGQGIAAQARVRSPEYEGLSETGLIQSTGKQAGADSVLLGRLYRFQQRIGRQYSVERPASVAFDLLLVRVSDGELIWYGYFDETQGTLAENLFHLSVFLKRKAKWLTAEQLADYGLEKLLSAFPKKS
jgi:hypothetical protein